MESRLKRSKSPKFCDVIRRGNPLVVKEGRSSAISVSACSKSIDRRAVSHARNDKSLDHGQAGTIAPQAASFARNAGFDRGFFAKPVHVAPLPDDRIGVRGRHRLIGASMPYRERRPAAPMRRCRADLVTQLARRSVDIALHCRQSAPQVGRDAKWETRENCPAREHVRVGGEQCGSHSSASRQSCNVNPLAIEPMISIRC